MNHSRLNFDLTADAVAAAARHRRRKRLVVMGSVPALLLLMGVFWFAETGTPSPKLTQQEEPPNKENPEPWRMEVIESDEELLALLADFGPVLTEKPDGTKVLLLTAAGK